MHLDKGCFNCTLRYFGKTLHLLNRLRDKGYLPGRINQLFHELRLAGNQASHSLSGDHRAALSHLKFTRELGIWFYKS